MGLSYLSFFDEIPKSRYSQITIVTFDDLKFKKYRSYYEFFFTNTKMAFLSQRSQHFFLHHQWIYAQGGQRGSPDGSDSVRTGAK